MIWHLRRSLLFALVFTLPARVARSEDPSPTASSAPHEYTDDIEHDFPLRSIGRLQITNMRGDIVVQGWALDKIHVKAVRKAIASSPDEAKKLLAAVGLWFPPGKDNIELSAEYGRGLTIEERLHERANPHTSMQMTVFAPSHLKLRVWAVDGSVSVRGWGNDLDVRTANGPITVDTVKSDNTSLLCPTCRMQVKNVRGSVRCMGGTGPIELSDVSGSQIYAESSSGALRARDVRGEQLYVSKTGAIFGDSLNGRIEFHTQKAPVEVHDSAGFLSGRTESGSILAEMKDWVFSDRALIESVQGNVTLGLPASFSGDVDLWSLNGKTHTTFPLRTDALNQEVGPEPVNHLLGRVGEGGGLLKIFSEKGNIQVLKGG